MVVKKTLVAPLLMEETINPCLWLLVDVVDDMVNLVDDYDKDLMYERDSGNNPLELE